MSNPRARLVLLLTTLVAGWLLLSGATVQHRIRLEGGGGSYVDHGCDYSTVHEFQTVGVDYEALVRWGDWGLLAGANGNGFFDRVMPFEGRCPPDEDCVTHSDWAAGVRVGLWHPWFEAQVGPSLLVEHDSGVNPLVNARVRLFPEKYVYLAGEFGYGAAPYGAGIARIVLGTKAWDPLHVEVGLAAGQPAGGFSFALSARLTDWLRLRATGLLHGTETSDYGKTFEGAGLAGFELQL